MKLKAVFINLLIASAGILFRLQANLHVVQELTIKIDIDPHSGGTSLKGLPAIKIC